MPMAFDNESVRLMVLNANDPKSAISNIAEMTGITEDEVKRIAYDKPESRKKQYQSYDWSLYDGIIIERRRQGVSWHQIAAEINIPWSTIAHRWDRVLKAKAEEQETEDMDTKTDVTPEQAENLIEAPNQNDDVENIKIRGWLNAVLDKLLDIGVWNAVEIRIRLDNGKGDHVEYEGACEIG